MIGWLHRLLCPHLIHVFKWNPEGSSVKIHSVFGTERRGDWTCKACGKKRVA